MLITSNGDYLLANPLKGKASTNLIIYISGEFGGAVFTLGYFNSEGDFVSLEDGIMVPNSQNRINTGIDFPIYARITSATGATAIVVDLAGALN